MAERPASRHVVNDGSTHDDGSTVGPAERQSYDAAVTSAAARLVDAFRAIPVDELPVVIAAAAQRAGVFHHLRRFEVDASAGHDRYSVTIEPVSPALEPPTAPSLELDQGLSSS